MSIMTGIVERETTALLHDFGFEVAYTERNGLELPNRIDSALIGVGYVGAIAYPTKPEYDLGELNKRAKDFSEELLNNADEPLRSESAVEEGNLSYKTLLLPSVISVEKVGEADVAIDPVLDDSRDTVGSREFTSSLLLSRVINFAPDKAMADKAPRTALEFGFGRFVAIDAKQARKIKRASGDHKTNFLGKLLHKSAE